MHNAKGKRPQTKLENRATRRTQGASTIDHGRARRETPSPKGKKPWAKGNSHETRRKRPSGLRKEEENATSTCKRGTRGPASSEQRDTRLQPHSQKKGESDPDQHKKTEKWNEGTWKGGNKRLHDNMQKKELRESVLQLGGEDVRCR